MAGIGIQLNRIFQKRTITSSVYGIAFSVTYTVGPMLMVVGCLLLMYTVLGFSEVHYSERELFSSSLLYIFIFSLLTTSPFNATLSKYMTDEIYLDHFDDVRASAIVGITANLTLSSLVAIPFYLRVLLVGHVPLYYVFTSYMAFLSLTLIFSVMIYNSILKNYKKIAWYFAAGMTLTFLLSLLFRFILHFTITYSMLLALAAGFLLIAVLELANVLRYFRKNSYNYAGPLRYFQKYWHFTASNFLYIFGLFAHNFVFWTLPWHLVVVNSYVSNQAYDMASFIAILTNISGSIFFLTNTEMHFHERYTEYLNSVINAKLDHIEEAKTRMFRTLSMQMLSLVQMQFIVSVVLFFLTYAFLPALGFSGLTMQIYPMLAVGYFFSQIMYSCILFLYSFNDTRGSLIAGLLFAGLSLLASFLSAQLTSEWYGAGFALAGLVTFIYLFLRLRWLEKNIDYYVFCAGTVMEPAKRKRPPDVVFRRGSARGKRS